MAKKTNEFNNVKVGQQQVYDLLVSGELSWQEIIRDLIYSEQLDPWDIDIIALTQSYLLKVKELEESSFFVSSKILLAAAILLRIKSELLLDRYIRSIDELLYGKNDEIKEKPQFTIDLEDVDLLPRTPLPRPKRVTLNELMSALERAMQTEQRRIKKEIAIRQASADVAFILPKIRINIRERIKEIYEKIITLFKADENKILSFSELAGNDKKERVSTFVPLLHLDFQEKIIMHQENPFDEIYINLFKK